jgi:ATP-dependent DNA helicase RecG
MSPAELSEIVANLRADGEHEAVEAKSAAGGLPDSITATLCAFGNQPGGGLVILGLDESAGFAPVSLSDPSAIQAGLASKARQAVLPPVQIALELVAFEGVKLIVGTVQELPASHKPCRVGSATGPAYLRVHDGDYQLSDLEIQMLTASRQQPTFDRAPVVDATINDLDEELVGVYLKTARAVDRRLASLQSDSDILHRTSVLVDGVPSLAGLMALGIFPQQFFPSLALQAVVPPQQGDPQDLRYRASQRFTGPIPYMLEEAVSWVSLNSPRSATSDAEGHLRDVPAWPLEAVRELVANALVHRDLGPWALGQTASLRLEPTRLTISNPGGLYGLAVARLRADNVDSFARNSALLQICQYTRLPDGRRIVEGLATGIPKVFQLAAANGLEPPRFHDHAVRFTSQLQIRMTPNKANKPPHSSLDSTAPPRERILDALEDGPSTSAALAQTTGTPRQTTRNILRALIEESRVARLGGPGRQGTTYTLR